MAVERTVERRALTDLSTSAVMIGSKCMLAFKYRYKDRLPSPTDSAAGLFGTAIHSGVELWYGGPGPITDDNQHAHKDLDLVKIVDEQWPELLPGKVWEHVENLAQMDVECEAVAQAILLQRPTLKAPRQTKAFLESQAQKDFQIERVKMLQLIKDFKEVRWPNDEDPYQAFLKAREVARRFQRQWQPLPRPLTVEEPFRLEFEGYVLRGAIDQVRIDPDLKTGTMRPPRIIDMKNGRNPLTQMEAFIQSFVYNEAVRQIDWLPDTDLVEFWLGRHHDDWGRTKKQRGKIVRPRHDRIALRVLNDIASRIKGEDFAPHYGMWCKQCDYRDLCEDEISLWIDDADSDGFVLEGAP